MGQVRQGKGQHPFARTALHGRGSGLHEDDATAGCWRPLGRGGRNAAGQRATPAAVRPGVPARHREAASGFSGQGLASGVVVRADARPSGGGLGISDARLSALGTPFHGTMQRIATWGEAVSPLLAAATAHHGRPVRPPSDPTSWDTGVPPTPDYDWREEAQSIADALPRWFAEAFQGSADPLPSKAHFHHLIAGLAALADWIGSDRQRHRRRLGGQGERLAPRRGPHRLCRRELRG